MLTQTGRNSTRLQDFENLQEEMHQPKARLSSATRWRDEAGILGAKMDEDKELPQRSMCCSQEFDPESWI